MCIRDRCFTDLDAEPFNHLRKTHLSPTTAAGVGRSGCPSRWAIEQVLSYVGGPPDPFSPAEIGTSAHALLEDLFGLPSEQRDRPHAAGLLSGLAERHPDLSTPDDQLTMGLWRDRVSAHMVGLFDIEDPRTVLTVAREQDMTGAQIDGVPSRGQIDRTELVRDESGAFLGVGIDDYKTGKVKRVFKTSKYPDAHGDQLRIYALMKSHMDGVMPVRARVLYVQHGQSREVSLSKQALGKTRKGFTAAWEDLGDYLGEASFPTRTSPLCGWCPLALICPAAERDDRATPKVDMARIGPHLGIASTRTGPARDEPSETDDASGTRPSMTDDPTDHDTGVPEMSEHLNEGKPWEESVGGGLNPTSYAATAAFGLTGLAVDTLHENGQRITGTTVSSMAHTLAWIVGRAQAKLTGTNSLQDGANTRIRGALRTTLGTLPPPFGQDEDA